MDYAANEGVEWVMPTSVPFLADLSNLFRTTISQELVFESDLLGLYAKNRAQVEALYVYAKEGQNKSVLDDYHAQRQAMSRYYLGAVVLSDVVIDVIRRELRRLLPGVHIDPDELRAALTQDILKRELVWGDKAEDARREIQEIQGRALWAGPKGAGVEEHQKDDSVETGPGAEASQQK